MKYITIILTTIFISTSSYAQVVKSVVLDSVVVEAVKKGFDVNDFIEMVKSDTSFLRAFRYLRNSPHTVTGNMTIYGKKNKISATRIRKANQIIKAKRRWIEIEEETVTGKFYNRKDEPGTYTAEIFDDIFFYEDTLPVTNPSVSISATTNTNNSGNLAKLKKLVFNPGAEISGVPVIGKRMAIFDDGMEEYYDYTIRVENFKDTLSCYVFSCNLKKPDEGLPVKNLSTWFDRRSFNIIYREYTLQYSGLLFSFDVRMKVKMDFDGTEVFPSEIIYKGFWDIPLRKKETVDFDLEFKLNED